jgi:hypothetical protein
MFNPDDYEPVAVRLDRWLKIYLVASSDVFPRVITYLHEYNVDYCVFRAELWLSDMLIATGWAEERRSERGITSASMLEVCETSAIGRALANAGIAGSDPSKRASREEMQKATRATVTPIAGGSGSSKPASEKQIGAIKAMCKKAGRTIPAGLEGFTASQASDMIQKLQETLDAKVVDGARDYYDSKPSGGYTGD